MEPKRYENAPPMVIAGIAGDFTAATRSEIPALWMRFAPHIGKVKGEIGKVAYGVVTDMTSGKEAMHYLSGVEVKATRDLPPDFESISLPAQRYAVFGHDGHVSKLPDTVGAIGRDWLPKSGLQHGEKPDLIERYGEEFNPETGLGGMEVWIPVKA